MAYLKTDSGDQLTTDSGDFLVTDAGTIATVTTLTASPPSPSVFGTSIILTATVTPSAATGTVSFYDGGSFIGSGTLSGGTATYTTSALSAATHSLTASYGGDASYDISSSSALSYTVTPNVSTTTTLSASPPPPVVHATMVVFTAIVTSSGSAATGTVEFRDGGALLGTGTLSGTTATYSTSGLDVGAHSLTATYLGDGTYTGSISSPLTYTIVTPAELPPQQPPQRGRMIGGRSRPLYVRAKLIRKRKEELEEIVGSLDAISTAPPPELTAPPPSPQLYRSLMDGLPPPAPQKPVKTPQKRAAPPPQQRDDDEEELAQILGAIL